MVASIYWRSLVEVTIAVGNSKIIKRCSEKTQYRAPVLQDLGPIQVFSPTLNPLNTLKSESQSFRFQKEKNSFNYIVSDENSWFSERINVRYQCPAQLHRQVGLTFLPSKQSLIITQSADALFHLYPPSSVLCTLPSGHGGGLYNRSATDDRCGRSLRRSPASISNRPLRANNWKFCFPGTDLIKEPFSWGQKWYSGFILPLAWPLWRDEGNQRLIAFPGCHFIRSSRYGFLLCFP